ncbi:MAG: cysteine synthase A [Eubacteriaceae bacterium]|nr:cysteine synthase A [Eubacteriaceae bacterium]
MKIAKNLTELIGNTPMVELGAFGATRGAKGKIIGKLEYFNPLGSVKDRVAYYMVLDAEQKGLINKDTHIIEPTSGSTGIGLAFVAAVRGYKVTLVMPETMSIERRQLLAALGADIVLTPGSGGMAASIETANDLAAKDKNAFIPQQFENPANPRAHYETTAVEILRDTEGEIGAFIAGAGTGGTITGVGKLLREKLPTAKIIAVEPSASPVLSGGEAGAHNLQGIGAGFIPSVLVASVIDEIILVSDEEAYEACRQAAKLEGLLVGISSGAALHAAALVAAKDEFEGKNIIVLLPDSGERYLSAGVF